MKSYVISVSAGTGCYRHIRISKNATLLKLHKAILNAFDFEDDHAHAFFMDNHYLSNHAAFFSMKMYGDERLTKSYKLEKLNLSKGDQFKYVFDFGDEWRFQCKVLRESDEQTDIPCVIRSVGDSPQQYPEWEEQQDDIPELLSPDQMEKLYDLVPLSRETIDLIHQYMDAAARLGLFYANQSGTHIITSTGETQNHDATNEEVIRCLPVQQCAVNNSVNSVKRKRTIMCTLTK